jgi:hypothetical protein
MNQMTERADVSRWLAGYDAAWRMPGTGDLARLFTPDTEIIAVDGQVAVVRAEVRYGDPPIQEYRDLWVIRFASDGRCAWFEEWPYAPED